MFHTWMILLRAPQLHFPRLLRSSAVEFILFGSSYMKQTINFDLHPIYTSCESHVKPRKMFGIWIVQQFNMLWVSSSQSAPPMVRLGMQHEPRNSPPQYVFTQGKVLPQLHLLPNQNCLPCGLNWGAIQESPLSYPPKGECLSSSHIAWRTYVFPFRLTKKLRFHFMNEPLANVFIFLQVQVKYEWGFNVLQQRLDEVFWAVKINEASNHLTGTIVECLRSVAKCNSATPFWEQQPDSIRVPGLWRYNSHDWTYLKRFHLFQWKSIINDLSSLCSFTPSLGAFQWIDLHNVYLQHSAANVSKRIIYSTSKTKNIVLVQI